MFSAPAGPQAGAGLVQVAHDEIGHVRILREALGAEAVPCPLVDIDSAFEQFFNNAFGTSGVKW